MSLARAYRDYRERTAVRGPRSGSVSVGVSRDLNANRDRGDLPLVEILDNLDIRGGEVQNSLFPSDRARRQGSTCEPPRAPVSRLSKSTARPPRARIEIIEVASRAEGTPRMLRRPSPPHTDRGRRQRDQTNKSGSGPGYMTPMCRSRPTAFIECFSWF